jgi:hypothetical protein
MERTSTSPFKLFELINSLIFSRVTLEQKKTGLWPNGFG